MRTWKWTIAFIILLLGVGAAQTQAAVQTTDVQGEANLQLIADHDWVGAGGQITLSVLIDAQAILAADKGLLEMKIPMNLEVSSSGTALWDQTNQSLRWELEPAVETKAWFDQISFDIPEQASQGTEYSFELEWKTEQEVVLANESIVVKVGTEVHQPFMQGYPDGDFRPENHLTRAETAAIVARMEGLVRYEDEVTLFDDVSPEHWAYAYIRQVQEQGYMIGYQGNFRPEEPITQAELIVLMLRLRGVEAIEGLLEGHREVLNHWSADAVGTAMTLHLLPEDFTLTAFDPDVPIQRQAAAQLINVGYKRGPLVDGEESVVAHFPDVPVSHPYFHWIEEASKVAHEGEHQLHGERLIEYFPEQTRDF